MDTFSEMLENHVSIKSANEVYEICKPLFDKFKLNYFDHTRVYPDGRFTTLTSDAKWCQHYFKKKYPISSAIVDTGIHLWTNYVSAECVKDGEELFNHYNGITIFKKHEDYCEFYNFAAPKENSKVLDFYLNHLDILEQFFSCFQEKANHLESQASKERLLLPE